MNTTNNTQEILTLEQAQELIAEKQADIMQDTEGFTDALMQLQDDDLTSLVTQDDQDQADDLLNTI